MTAILQFCVAAFLLLASFSQGAIPQGKKIKTSAKQLNTFDKFFIRTFHPEIPIDKILEEENKSGVQTGNNDGSIQDDYSGTVEFFSIELPLLFLQLNKMGDEILLPTFQADYGYYFCYLGICSGFLQTYDFQRPILRNVTSATLTSSVNGTQLHLKFHIGSVQVQCPEFVMVNTDYNTDGTEESTIWNNGTIFIQNYTIETTANISVGDLGLEVSNFTLYWNIDDFRTRYENGTHTFPDGRQEEWGAIEEKWHETWMGGWEDYTDITPGIIQDWLNCFLSNGAVGDERKCRIYQSEPLHRQTFAELLHAFGLNDLNKIRNNLPSPAEMDDVTEKENSDIGYADEGIRIIHELLFDYTTHVLQTGKVVAALQDGMYPWFILGRTYTYDFTKEVCASNGTNCELISEQITIGGEWEDENELPSMIEGYLENDVEFLVSPSNISYKLVVPYIALYSSDFSRISTNLNTEVQHVYSGLNLTVANSSVGIQGDFELSEGQYTVSNVKVILELGEVSMSIYSVAKRENGSWVDLEPIRKDVAPEVMELWRNKDNSGVALEDRYSSFIEEKINDILAGRSKE